MKKTSPKKGKKIQNENDLKTKATSYEDKLKREMSSIKMEKDSKQAGAELSQAQASFPAKK